MIRIDYKRRYRMFWAKGISVQPVTIQRIMWHNSIRTTLGWYTHLEEGDVITEALELIKNDKSVFIVLIVITHN